MIAMGMDIDQIRFRVVRPTLLDLGKWTPSAENLVLGTAIQESRLRYIVQLLGGPAKGICQMEPATHNDIWVNYLSHNTELMIAVRNIVGCAVGTPPSQKMEGNLYYAVAMCRIHYLRVPHAIPAANDALALASYWKQFYNTPKGKGTVEEAVEAFRMVI